MQDVFTILQTLHRPDLLMRTARIGARDYKRTHHLSRLLGYGQLPRHSSAILKLLDIEDDLNVQRKAKDSAYSVLRHVDVMIAIVGEAQFLRPSP